MSATVETLIWLAVKSRIESLPLFYPVAWPAKPFEPPYSENKLLPYIRTGYVLANPVRNLIADGQKHTRTGSLILSLVYPLGQEVEVYKQVAGVIADHFRDGTEMREGRVCVSVPSYPAVQSGFEQDGYWIISINIPWRVFA